MTELRPAIAVPSTPPRSGWGSAARAERGLQAAQLVILVVLAMVVVAVAAVTGRGMVDELARYRDEQGIVDQLYAFRYSLQEQEAALWRNRAAGGTGITADLARNVLEISTKVKAFSALAVNERSSPRERAAIRDTIRSLDEILATVTRSAGATRGSGADRSGLDRIQVLSAAMKSSAAAWAEENAAQLETANARVTAATWRIIRTTGATALIALLLGLLTALLVSRSRRRVIEALTEATDRLRRLADTDPLTQLSNQRLLHDRLQETAFEALSTGRPLSAIMIDLDHFKAVNDTYGHPVGDAVLVETARRLEEAARSTDLVARIGGEEFLMLLPDTTADAALAVAERIRTTIAATDFPGGVGRLSASLGVSTLHDDVDADGLLQEADAALYWAKTHGRNAVFPFEPTQMTELSPSSRARQMARADGLTALRALARAVDAKDPATQLHSIRVADMAVMLATALGWTPEQSSRLREAGVVHDVGKIGIPDAILLKPSALTTDERELMQDHARLGARIVSEVLDADQVEWVAHHHERWDGGGYPAGLREDAIPIGARILTVADCWDAMTSTRDYNDPLTAREALEECRRCSGTHFWPDAIQALERLDAVGALPVPRPSILASA